MTPTIFETFRRAQGGEKSLQRQTKESARERFEATEIGARKRENA